MKNRKFVAVPYDVTIHDVGANGKVVAHNLREDALEYPQPRVNERGCRLVAVALGLAIYHGVVMPLVDVYSEHIFAFCETVRHIVGF